MGTATNPIGRYAIMGSLVISVVMVIYYFTGGDGKIAFGFAIISLAVAAFIYIIYARMNTVERSGYMSLLLVILTGLLLPFFFLAQAKGNNDSALDQYNTRLHYSAGLYTTYCSSCHGLFGQGLKAPQLNNGLKQRLNGNTALDKLTADDIRRIITGGIVDSTKQPPTSYLMPQWGQVYGGPFNDDDINALVALIMSSDPTLQAKASAPLSDNGFALIPKYLTTQAQRDAYQSELADLNRPPGEAIDLTAMKQVTFQLTTGSTGAYVFQYSDPKTKKTYTNIKIKAGTEVIWANVSDVAHSVTPNKTGAFPSKDLLPVSQSYNYTFAAPGTFPFYCTFHSSMVGEVDVVA